ncbi:hypothetical protein PGB90_007498 [Kerria lacca]
MLYEQKRCKKEKEQKRNVKHEITRNHEATNINDYNKSMQNFGKEKFVERDNDRSHRSASVSKSIISSQNARSTKSSRKSKTRSTGKYLNNDTDSIRRKNMKCFEQEERKKMEPCVTSFQWQHSKYKRDECGSGIVPLRTDFKANKKVWCSTPLSMYQSTIGELARKILCNEVKTVRNVNSAPPCNVCEYVLPLCRGYYRKYDCIRPCEEELAVVTNGKKIYRDRVERYWHPCLTKEEKQASNVRSYAAHNSFLGEKIRRKFNDMIPCW